MGSWQYGAKTMRLTFSLSACRSCLVQRAPSCIPMLSCCCCCLLNRYLFKCKGNGNCQGKCHAGPHLALKENQIPDTLICYECIDNADGELENNIMSDVEQQLLFGVDK